MVVNILTVIELLALVAIFGIYLLNTYINFQEVHHSEVVDYIQEAALIVIIPVAVVNFVFSVVYFIRRPKKSRSLVLPIIGFLVALGVVVALGIGISVAVSYTNMMDKADKQGKIDDSLSHAITVEEAKSLLDECKITNVGTHAGYRNFVDDTETGVWLSYFEGQPSGLGLSQKTNDEVLAAAKTAKKKCADRTTIYIYEYKL